MQRPMIGFALDAHGDWTARLSRGHVQHVRHTPPFQHREWVTSEADRAARLGQRLDCLRCDDFELPADFVAYRRTATFSETSIPDALRQEHATKAGVWGKILVEDGRLRYAVPPLARQFELTPTQPGIVVSEVQHHVEPCGTVRFYVEFYRAPLGAA